MENQEEMEDQDAIAYVLVVFSEIEETKAILASLPEVHGDDLARERTTERFHVIMYKYLEQPHLLDPHLEWMLNMMMEIVRDEKSPPSLVHLAFMILYIICRVRRDKIFMHHLPHEVSDVQPVLDMLSRQDSTEDKTWETSYMLLLWLSVICLIPFDLYRLDGNLQLDGNSSKEPTMVRILAIAKSFMLVTNASRNAAFLLISNFMKRPDVRQKCLVPFLDWSLSTILQKSDKLLGDIMVLDGTLNSLAKLFKHGDRDGLQQYAPKVLHTIDDKQLSKSSEVVLRKLNIKLIQRLGLTFLKPRLAAWRYQRGSRSLAANLSMAQTNAVATAAASEMETQEEDYDIPPELETVIEHLLVGLKDTENIVRWSAAKGIGRVTGRLHKELADEVVGSVLDCFSFQETDNAWHGGCLALAELGRRGLLLPSRLTDVVPLVIKSMAYDEKRGARSIGINVRDAACYVCWSLARAFEPKELKPFVNQIARALVITAVFDKNVNCRRAASAAFQENVGRQGTFPHGIDILTAVDYYAVGNLKNCYLTISVDIAGFPEYTMAVIDHLLETKVNHWDDVIRKLATKALHNLTPRAPDYMAATVLPRLLTMATGVDLHTRHGAIMACAEVVHALYKVGLQTGRSVQDTISPECVEALKKIHQTLHDRKQYRGLGGELMRPAVCLLIEKLSLSKMPFKNDPVVAGWQSLIDDTIKNLHQVGGAVKDTVIAAAVSALSALCEEYYQAEPGQADSQMQDALVSRYVDGLKSPQMLTCRGSALALTSLPRFMIHSKLKQILEGLQQTCVRQDEESFIEAKRDAVKTIAQVCVKAGVCVRGAPDSFLCSENVTDVFGTLFRGMSDYTTGTRGDVGSLVRKAAMTGLMEVTMLAAGDAPEILSPDLMRRIMCCLAQQTAEKIDWCRAHAGQIFLHLLHSTEPVVPHIPHREELLSIFPPETKTSLNWLSASQAFQCIAKLLGLPQYQYHTLLGLTVSVGGMTPSTVQYSSQALFDYLRGIQEDETQLTQFGDTLLTIFRENLKINRVSIPFLNMLNQMLSRSTFEIFTTQENHQFCMDLLSLCIEFRKTTNVSKLIVCISVICGLIQFQGGVRKKVLSQLLILLCNPFPVIRKTTASHMYEMLLIYDDIAEPDVLEDVMTVLSDTEWMSDIETVRAHRNQLCDWLEVPRPQLLTKKSAKAS